MTNFIDNTLTVFGPKQDVETFVQRARADADTPFSLNRLVPMPVELYVPPLYYGTGDLIISSQRERTQLEETNLAKFGSKDWYDWRNENWGTKWEADQGSLQKYGPLEDDSLQRALARYSFRTANGTPVKALYKVTREIPALAFFLRWSDGTWHEWGYLCGTNGFVIARDEMDQSEFHSYLCNLQMPSRAPKSRD